MRALKWRSVGSRGDPYPRWVRDLRGRSGVYIVRDASTGEVLYVGESHSDRLYETLTRHFQAWTRHKRWWSGMRGGRDPGTYYPRASVEVAALVMARSRARADQDALIDELCPRDNLDGAEGCGVVEIDPDADVPF